MRTSFLCVLLTSAVACGSEPTLPSSDGRDAPALSATGTHTKFRLANASTIIDDPCTGETLTITGTFYLQITQVEDARTGEAGGFHEQVLSQFRGRVVGASGTEYRFQSVVHDAVNESSIISGPNQAVGNFVANFELNAQGRGSNFLFTAVLHFTEGPDGVLRVEFEKRHTECRPA